MTRSQKRPPKQRALAVAKLRFPSLKPSRTHPSCLICHGRGQVHRAVLAFSFDSRIGSPAHAFAQPSCRRTAPCRREPPCPSAAHNASPCRRYGAGVAGRDPSRCPYRANRLRSGECTRATRSTPARRRGRIGTSPGFADPGRTRHHYLHANASWCLAGPHRIRPVSASTSVRHRGQKLVGRLGLEPSTHSLNMCVSCMSPCRSDYPIPHNQSWESRL